MWQKNYIESGVVRTRASEETSALSWRLRPLGHASIHAQALKGNQFWSLYVKKHNKRDLNFFGSGVNVFLPFIFVFNKQLIRFRVRVDARGNYIEYYIICYV